MTLKSGVEVGWLSAQRIDDVRLAVDLFVNHESQNSHHSSTSVVQFDGTFLQLFFLGCLPCEESISKVTGVFSVATVSHDKQLEETNESEKLDETGIGDICESDGSGFDGRKRGTGVVNVSRNTRSEGCVDVSENGKHTNASVFDFNVTKTVESVLVDSVQHVQRVPESQRSLGTKFGIESRERCGCSGCFLLRSKGSGSADKKG